MWSGHPLGFVACIEEFLTPGEEILLPADAGEVASILQHLSDAERKQIGQRARERILSEHTAEHRAEQFEQIVSDCCASTSHSSAIHQATGDTGQAFRSLAPQS